MNRTDMGAAADGSTIETVVLENPHHRVEILTIGARLASWRMGDVAIIDPVQGIDHALGKGRHHASVIAPVANRIAGATAILDGERLTFEANEGPNSLHSGASGSQFANWAVTAAQATEASLSLRQVHGSGGFPGNRVFTVTWTLDGPTLRLVITGRTDRPTFVNPAVHPYLCAPEGTRLQVDADRIVATGEGKIPTGDLAGVEGTPFDLRQPVAPPDTIDHCYLVSGDLARTCVRLLAPTHRLDLATDAPGVQVYSGKPGLLAIEPEIHPDAPNHAHFPSIVLRPEETFRQESHWTVTPA